MVTLLL